MTKKSVKTAFQEYQDGGKNPQIVFQRRGGVVKITIHETSSNQTFEFKIPKDKFQQLSKVLRE